jgi:hypothetical protein
MRAAAGKVVASSEPSAVDRQPIRGKRSAVARAGHRPRAICWSDRFDIDTRAAVRDGRALARDGLRRHFRGKGEDSGARKTSEYYS